jgi:hypothetical protein
MASVKVELTKPIELYGKRVAEIELREPNGGLYVKHGEPRVLVFNASGSGYWVPQQDSIKAYLEALIVHDLGADLVKLMSLEDAMTTQEALFDFFTVAAANVNAKRAAQKSMPSSSASES